MLCGCFFLHPNYDPDMPISSVLGSPLVTGKWVGNTFINEWTGYTVTLPPGFLVSDFEEKIPREYALDFLLYHSENKDIVISLAYFDVTQGERKEHTAEDYLYSSKEGLLRSPDRTFTFNDDLGNAVIGEWEYVVMSGTFVDADDELQIVHNTNRYAHRWVGTMVVFVAMYADESKDIVNAFFDSIEQKW